MRRQSAFSRVHIICRTGVLAAQTAYPQGARLRDIRFFVQLFSNWLEHAIGDESVEIRSMQVSRFLSDLVADGVMRELRRTKSPRYLLTRAGVVEVLREVVNEPLFRRPNVLFFVRFFVSSYRNILIRMVAEGGERFPPALRLELEDLLDVSALMRRQRQLAEREQENLRLRAHASQQMAALAAKRYREGWSDEQIIAEMEEKHPYELNSQKPLNELFQWFPAEVVQWELTSGPKMRAEQLWAPMEELWASYLRIVSRLSD